MPDPFRSQYRQLTDAEKEAIDTIKNRAKDLHAALVTQLDGQDPRGMAIARTKLEECVFWAVKAITA